jgi:hypothetical protein
MIRGGTTAFLSIETVRHTHHAVKAVHQSGLMGVDRPLPDGYDGRLQTPVRGCE